MTESAVLHPHNGLQTVAVKKRSPYSNIEWSPYHMLSEKSKVKNSF